MAYAGLFCLVVATGSTLVGLVGGLARPAAARALRGCQVVTFLAGLAALGLLAALVASGDPTVAYVLAHRAPAGAPIGYRLAAVWAGQSGGLLLWVVETALVALAVSPRTQPRAVALLCGIQSCLLGLALVANPFAAAGPTAAGPAVAAGGLNPLLQNPMMMIHPPLLFLGYALLGVPFAITLGALLERDPGPWPGRVWPWVLTAWLALTAGNGFGALWAYKTFGWGGFWSWDPVENTSFVPWALCAVTVHSLWLARGREPWLRTAAYGALGAFLAVLYGSFLARSGLLAGASVHAYIAGERLFVYALGTLLVGGLILSVAFLTRWQREGTGGEPAPQSPRLAPAAWGTRLLLGLAGVVLVGMSLPLLGGKPTTTLYDTVLLPFALALLLLLAWPARWVRPSAEGWARGLVATAFGLLVVAALLSFSLSPEGGVPAAVGVVLAPLLGLACLVALGRAAGEFLFKRSRPWLRRGAYLAHLGLAALVLGALLSGYGSRTQSLTLAPSDEITLAAQQIKLLRVIRVGEETLQADLTLNGQPGQVSIEESPSFQMSLRHAWVVSRFWGDVYLTPTTIVPEHPGPEMQGQPPGVTLDFTLKPGMRLVWLGMWLIGAGVALALMRRALHPSLTGAPAPPTGPGSA